jgi:predicted glycoside hydrolase/deacetylase ChbG (UPF0249 family)
VTTRAYPDEQDGAVRAARATVRALRFLPVQIVLNADDFGSSTDTVAATIECFRAGLLTSATLMVGMPATESALDFARSQSEFSFGVHLLFTGDGPERPLSDVREIPALVDAEGSFLPTKTMRVRALLRRIPVVQIEREIIAQVDYVRAHGVPVSHVDSHRHLHKFAPFREALRRTLPRFGIERVRNVQDIYLRRPLGSPTFWAGPIWRRALMRTFRTTEHFYMPTSAADLNWHEFAERLPSGRSLEVGLHPGTEEEWRRRERDSLAPFVTAVRRLGHELTSWNGVGSSTSRT